jgi:hypothetical protein
LVEPTITGDGESIPVTNVIFVHGLGGSAKGTWTHENEFWPEWLPGTKGLENARIMAFGYDADWNKIWRPNNLLDISDFGDQLLNYLLLHYSNCGDVSILKFPLITCRLQQFFLRTAWADLLLRRYNSKASLQMIFTANLGYDQSAQCRKVQKSPQQHHRYPIPRYSPSWIQPRQNTCEYPKSDIFRKEIRRRSPIGISNSRQNQRAFRGARRWNGPHFILGIYRYEICRSMPQFSCL